MADYEIAAMCMEDLATGEMRGLLLDGWSVVIARVGDQFYALSDRCSHAAARLSPGRLRNCIVTCPLHGARFDVTNGFSHGGTYPAIKTFPVRLTGGTVMVTLPKTAPSMTEIPR